PPVPGSSCTPGTKWSWDSTEGRPKPPPVLVPFAIRRPGRVGRPRDPTAPREYPDPGSTDRPGNPGLLDPPGSRGSRPPVPPVPPAACPPVVPPVPVAAPAPRWTAPVPNSRWYRRRRGVGTIPVRSPPSPVTFSCYTRSRAIHHRTSGDRGY